MPRLRPIRAGDADTSGDTDFDDGARGRALHSARIPQPDERAATSNGTEHPPRRRRPTGRRRRGLVRSRGGPVALSPRLRGRPCGSDRRDRELAREVHDLARGGSCSWSGCVGGSPSTPIKARTSVPTGIRLSWLFARTSSVPVSHRRSRSSCRRRRTPPGPGRGRCPSCGSTAIMRMRAPAGTSTSGSRFCWRTAPSRSTTRSSGRDPSESSASDSLRRGGTRRSNTPRRRRQPGAAERFPDAQLSPGASRWHAGRCTESASARTTPTDSDTRRCATSFAYEHADPGAAPRPA